MFRHLSESEALLWADTYREATGRWPAKNSGAIAGTVCETWAGVDRALRLGRLGLPGGSSLPRLLAEQRGARNPKAAARPGWRWTVPCARASAACPAARRLSPSPAERREHRQS